MASEPTEKGAIIEWKSTSLRVSSKFSLDVDFNGTFPNQSFYEMLSTKATGSKVYLEDLKLFPPVESLVEILLQAATEALITKFDA